MLVLKNLTYKVQSDEGVITIIDNISLSLGEDTLTVLTGPNGGGKTSLAKLIIGIEKPTSGKIIFDGTDITDMDVHERAKLGISYAFQQPTRIKGINVGELLGIATGKDQPQYQWWCKYLTDVGLCANDYIERQLDSSLSGGEMKRIEIATVLARDSKLNIFDEPEAGIDLWSFARLTETFKALHDKGDRSMIIISHQERILELADEIIVISGGKILVKGTKDEVFPKIMGEVQYGCEFLKDQAAL